MVHEEVGPTKIYVKEWEKSMWVDFMKNISTHNIKYMKLICVKYQRISDGIKGRGDK